MSEEYQSGYQYAKKLPLWDKCSVPDLVEFREIYQEGDERSHGFAQAITEIIAERKEGAA